jgi:tRNA threonylcarbamoyladenosine modification (KEOPS) complex  Pcc1 subunit
MYTLEVEIPFETKRHAEIALNSVIQDEEPRSGSSIERKIKTNENSLQIEWRAEEARILRTSANSLLQLVTLVMQTIEQFDNLE